MKDIIMMCLYYKDIHIDTNFWPYFNIQCGREGSHLDLGMQPDNTGDNISAENRYWSEITGLYWAWKNFEKTKYVGLCSYRRFFNLKESSEPLSIVDAASARSELEKIDYMSVVKIFEENDIILPVAYKYPWSIRRVCSKNYNDQDFSILERYIMQHESEYYEDYKYFMYNSNKMIGHNMFIMRWDDFQDYCAWVFGILIPLSKEIDPTNYPINQVRVFGYMHELLLSVYIRKRKMKSYSSQILWVENVETYSRFNSILYRTVSDMIYKFSQVLGGYYPHIIKRKS
jgi:hypothetical protein